MKSSIFEKLLAEMGYTLVRISGHRIWSNGQRQVAVPHGRNVNRMLAKRVLKEIGYKSNVPEINYFTAIAG